MIIQQRIFILQFTQYRIEAQKFNKMKQKQINRIMKKHKDTFEILENYDKTRELPFRRKRIDITLSVGVINKLKSLKEKTGKPISQLIEEKF
jgi:c-di-AMP phosphodiesterase-like protein